jgi:hypothetical protein
MKIESYIEPHWSLPSLQGHVFVCEDCGMRFKMDLAPAASYPDKYKVPCPRCLVGALLGPMLADWRKRLAEPKP